MERSVWQTAVAAVRTTTSPGPATGLGRSTRSSLRGALSTAVRIPFTRPPSCRVPASPTGESGVARHRIDDGDLFDREAGDDLDPVLVNDQHLFDPHAPLELLAVLGLEREHHAFLDLDRVIERPDARNDRLVVLRD